MLWDLGGGDVDPDVVFCQCVQLYAALGHVLHEFVRREVSASQDRTLCNYVGRVLLLLFQIVHQQVIRHMVHFHLLRQVFHGNGRHVDSDFLSAILIHSLGLGNSLLLELELIIVQRFILLHQLQADLVPVSLLVLF